MIYSKLKLTFFRTTEMEMTVMSSLGYIIIILGRLVNIDRCVQTKPANKHSYYLSGKGNQGDGN